MDRPLALLRVARDESPCRAGPRRSGGACALLAAAALIVAACTGGGGATTEAAPDDAIGLDDAPRRYRAEWLIDAEAVDADGPGFPFVYREAVDDASGSYLVQSPNHLAVQTSADVLFCAAIFRQDPFCASRKRPDGAPNVLAYPVQLLRTWGPEPLYDLASYREISLVAASDTTAWDRHETTLRDAIVVECFVVVGETPAAAKGFEVCFTADDLHLVASVDLQGDLVYEIDLISYERQVTAEDFETGLEAAVEPRPELQDQLLDLFPEVPAPRPTPTPIPTP